MTKMSDVEVPKLTLEEVLSDGSTITNPAADHRRLFLGEDGLLHLKDSAGAVTNVGGTPADILDIPTAEMDDTLVLAPDGAGGVEFRAEAGGGGGVTQAYVGYNTVGGSFDTGFTTFRYYAKKVTLANDALMTDIELYVQQTADANVNQIHFALWDDNGSGTAPNSLLFAALSDSETGLVLEDTGSGPRIARWFGCPIGRWLPAGDYWPAWMLESTQLSVAYDDTGTDDLYMSPAGGQLGDWGLWTPGTATDRCYSLRANTIR